MLVRGLIERGINTMPVIIFYRWCNAEFYWRKKTTISNYPIVEKLLLLSYSLHNNKYRIVSIEQNKTFALRYFIHPTRKEIFGKLSISTSRKKKKEKK